MQIKPYQIPHFARQIDRFKQIRESWKLDTYTLKGTMWSKINDFERYVSDAKFETKLTFNKLWNKLK